MDSEGEESSPTSGGSPFQILTQTELMDTEDCKVNEEGVMVKSKNYKMLDYNDI